MDIQTKLNIGTIVSYILGGAIVIVAIVVLCVGTNGKSETPKTARQIQIEKQFSTFDGSHIELTKFIKKTMNDPDSYKHIETVYRDMINYIIVQTTYSGTNVFGARVKNSIKAKIDNNGNIIDIIED